MAWQLVIAFALTLISVAAARPPQQQTDNTIDSVKGPTAEPGQTIRVIFGTVYIETIFISWGQLTRVVPVKKKGGKK